MTRKKRKYTKESVIVALRALGENDAANELAHWKSNRNTDSGWDGWLRRAFPQLVDRHFPDLGETPNH